MTSLVDLAGFGELRAHYRSISADELLAQAVDAHGLTQIARQALQDELNRRGLTSADIERFGDYLRKAEILNPRLKENSPIAYRVNGCGTCLLGERDHRPDGSYVVTKWLSLFWIPLLPLQILRVKCCGEGYQILDVWRPGRQPLRKGADRVDPF
jgi:hypothetical protein